MSTITFHNESENQLKLIEALLKEMKIEFEVSEELENQDFTDWQKELIDEGLKDIEEGKIISSEEVRKNARFSSSRQRKLFPRRSHSGRENPSAKFCRFCRTKKNFGQFGSFRCGSEKSWRSFGPRSSSRSSRVGINDFGAHYSK